MLSKILSTATLIVVAWLSVQMLYTQRALETSQVSFQQGLDSVRAELGVSVQQNEDLGADVLQRMEELSVEQVKLAKSSNGADPKLLKAKNQTITKMGQTASMQDVQVKVLKADLLGAEKQGEQAAELLLSTKSTIWKLSEKWGKSKDALRGLMAPVDILAAKWKRGDYSGNTKSIQKVLQDVLSAQAQS